MSASEKEMQAEIDKIKDNQFDVKGHFDLLFANMLVGKNKTQDKLLVVDRLLDASALDVQMKKEYPGQEYVLLFYAHEPHSPAMPQRYQEEPRAHTSLLLCKVTNNKIDHVLNVDGYNYTGYADPSRNPHVKQRLALHAQGSADPGSRTPLQTASWLNMNCVVYSLTFAERIIELFKTQPDLFPTQSGPFSPEALVALEKEVVAGVVGKYVRESGERYIVDSTLTKHYNNRIRQDLAESYQQQYRANQALLQSLVDSPVVESPVLTVVKGTGEQPSVDKTVVSVSVEQPVKLNPTVVDPHKSPASPLVSTQHSPVVEPIVSRPQQALSGTEPRLATQVHTQGNNNNYYFLLQAGIVFSAALSLAALVVAALALASIVCPPVGIAAAFVAVGAGLSAYGLFNAKNTSATSNTNSVEQELDNPKPI